MSALYSLRPFNLQGKHKGRKFYTDVCLPFYNVQCNLICVVPQLLFCSHCHEKCFKLTNICNTSRFLIYVWCSACLVWTTSHLITSADNPTLIGIPSFTSRSDCKCDFKFCYSFKKIFYWAVKHCKLLHFEITKLSAK